MLFLQHIIAKVKLLNTFCETKSFFTHFQHFPLIYNAFMFMSTNLLEYDK